MTDPIARIQADRQDARNHDDPNADLCVLALSESGKPSVRTLVLREVTADGFTLFVNKTSPKWSVIQANKQAEMLIWYANSQTQYRISGQIEELEPSVIDQNWHRRPADSKYMDYTYQSLGPQSSKIDARNDLVDHIQALKAVLPEDEMATPESAAGILLRPALIEMLDLNMPNRIHDRRQYALVDGKWQATQIIP
ncbi:MAG: pyridoxamine 5'-phosphate oxidase family protein [Candidatus Azotimanducaceae bacterium WSBS_2022_MAG_OTU7]